MYGRALAYLVVALLWLASLGSVQAAGDVAAWVRAIDAAQPRGAGLDAAGKSYSVGHLRVEFVAGRLFPIFAGERLVGALFDGEGSFRYRSADPLEAANFRTNLKRATKYSPQESTFGDSVEAMLIWDPARAALLPGEGGWPAGETPAEVVDRLHKLRERRAKDYGFPPELYLAQMLVEPVDDPPAVAQIFGAKHDLVYSYDTLRYQDEEIWALDKAEFVGVHELKGLRFLEVLSSQPIGRDRLEMAPPRFRLVDVDLELVNPEGETADLEVRETYEIFSPVAALDLGLLSYRIAQQQLRPYRLTSVTLADGSPLPFVHRKHNLLVGLPRRMEAGEKVTLVFRTAGEILYRPDRDSYWELGTFDWLPLPNRLDMQFFTYHAVVKAAKPFEAFSPGVTVRRWEEDEGRLACAEFLEERPIMFPVILAGKYKKYERSHQGITIRVVTYVTKKADRMEEIAENLFALMELYGKLLGEYPYKELKVIEINEWGFGQAPPGIIFITREAFETGSRVRGWSVGINARLAHELAHTWWGDISPWASSQDQWLSESTADYYAAVAMSLLWRESKFDDILQEWIQESQYVKDNASLLLANQLSGDGAFRDRWMLLYNKGPLVLHALRQELGDNTFFTAFKTLLTNFRYKHLTTRDAIAVINWVTKQERSEWAERYVLGTEWPDAKELKKKNRRR